MKQFIIFSLLIASHFTVNDALAIEPTIIDGSKAEIGQFPYYAFLIIHFTGTHQHAYCGASLISNEWLLTAAHCIAGTKSVDILFAETNLTDLKPEHVMISVEKTQFYIHPEYCPLIALNDIALIHLPMRIETSAYIQPVKLPNDCQIPRNIDVIAVGHGAISDHSEISTQLNYVLLKTTPQAFCRKVFPIISDRKSIICAMNSERPQSVCKADSGGPLVIQSSHTLVGVACFVVQEGCETGAPQGFTNVYRYLNWIKSITDIKVPDCE